jgi:DNA-binding response OmpR family regulator
MNNKTRILVVDDDTNICQLVKLYLDKEGYENRSVNNGKQALEVFREFTPNLVILDIMLPGMDGDPQVQQYSHYHAFSQG